MLYKVGCANMACFIKVRFALVICMLVTSYCLVRGLSYAFLCRKIKELPVENLQEVVTEVKCHKKVSIHFRMEEK